MIRRDVGTRRHKCFAATPTTRPVQSRCAGFNQTSNVKLYIVPLHAATCGHVAHLDSRDRLGARRDGISFDK